MKAQLHLDELGDILVEKFHLSPSERDELQKDIEGLVQQVTDRAKGITFDRSVEVRSHLNLNRERFFWVVLFYYPVINLYDLRELEEMDQQAYLEHIKLEATN